MAQDITFDHGDPGIASFATQSYGGPGEPRFGDGVAKTTTHRIKAGADLNLKLYSVIAIIGGVLSMAGAPGVAQGAATGTITFSSAAPADNDTVTINGVVYTFKTALTSGGTARQVLAGANVTAAATNLVAAIMGTAGEGTTYGNGTDPDANVSASNSAGVVTVFARDPGDEGNAISLAKSGTNIAVSGANLTGGSDDADALPFGILAAPVVMTNGQEMDIPVYREGEWDMDQLVWGAGWNTDEQKKNAFTGSLSPTLYVSKKKYNNDQIAV